MTSPKAHQTPLSTSSALVMSSRQPTRRTILQVTHPQWGPLHLFPSSHWRRVINQVGGHTTLDLGYTALPYMGTLRGSLQPPPPTTAVLKSRFTMAISYLTLKHLHTRSEYRAIPLSPERERKAEQIKVPRHIAHPTPGYQAIPAVIISHQSSSSYQQAQANQPRTGSIIPPTIPTTSTQKPNHNTPRNLSRPKRHRLQETRADLCLSVVVCP